MELLTTPMRRKQLAQRAAEPGVSVSSLAQENDINVNMLFKWLRELREGRLDGVMHRQAMLPVMIVNDNPDHLPSKHPTVSPDAVVTPQRTATNEPGVIEI
ncbi:transposase [Undibacterium crateris]|uniref:transposase n=1 Tax=Undibacterium crateris TaxID=2528175 RepID=UPI001389C761|nr:transposase [Undibacterium crateris]NDI87636.1 transposase [Undibacterium crateris]